MTSTSDTSSTAPSVTPHLGQDAIEVVRSAEQLQVGRTVRASGRAVFRKYLITETITQTYEIRREEVRLDIEPITSTDDAGVEDRRLFEDRVVEVVLHREVPVVQLRVEAFERVRLHIDTVTEQTEVSADVREERIDLEAPGR